MSAYPDELQTLLLKAALLEGDRARDAITNWVDRVDLNDVDWASQRMVPLFFENVRTLGMTLPHFDRLKGVHRYWWFRNSRNMAGLKAVASGLRKEGVEEIMLLKGCALANFYYANVALRPMNDIDILVRPNHAVTAMNALLRMGFRRFAKDAQIIDADSTVHALTQLDLSHSDYGNVDLHWEILGHHGSPSFDAMVWKNAERRELDGEYFHVPNAADLLLHVIDHGLPENVMQPIWWVADAHMILRHERAFDWPYFCSQAARIQRAGIVNEAFRWTAAAGFSDAFQNMPPVPQAWGDTCYALYRRYVAINSRVFRTQRALTGFLKYCEGQGFAPTPGRFLPYLQRRWGVCDPKKIPARALEAWRR